MKPTNNKSLLHFVFDQMDKLDRKEITVDEAKAQSSLAKQANNALMYEIKRADINLRLAEHNRSTEKIELRECETNNPNT